MANKNTQNQAPSIGRAVHYVLLVGLRPGEHRPATIVRVNEADTVNLAVQRDGPNDRDEPGVELPSVFWVGTVYQDDSEQPAFGTYHFPEYVEPQTAAQTAAAVDYVSPLILKPND